jgi:hypothetical protein
MAKTWEATILAVLLLSIPGCGGLRYSQVSPEAKDFHPQRIAVLPADATAFPEAKGDVDRLFAELLNDRGWFSSVVGGATFGRRLETDTELRQAVSEYLAKLDKVSFSDHALSSRIGSLIDVEALLLVRVDYWNYTTEKDTKVGRVGLRIVLIETKTGKTMWTANHYRNSDYLLIKPDLTDVAKGLIREMIGYMPH